MRLIAVLTLIEVRLERPLISSAGYCIGGKERSLSWVTPFQFLRASAEDYAVINSVMCTCNMIRKFRELLVVRKLTRKLVIVAVKSWFILYLVHQTVDGIGGATLFPRARRRNTSLALSSDEKQNFEAVLRGEHGMTTDYFVYH